MILCTGTHELSYFVNRWKLLLVGRFLLSIGIGILTIGVPMYINEVAPKWCRGGLSVLHSFMHLPEFIGFKHCCNENHPGDENPLALVISSLVRPNGSAVRPFIGSFYFYTKAKNIPKAMQSIDFYLNNATDKDDAVKTLEEAAAVDLGLTAKKPLHIWEYAQVPELQIPMLLCFAVAIEKKPAAAIRSYDPIQQICLWKRA